MSASSGLVCREHGGRRTLLRGRTVAGVPPLTYLNKIGMSPLCYGASVRDELAAVARSVSV